MPNSNIQLRRLDRAQCMEHMVAHWILAVIIMGIGVMLINVQCFPEEDDLCVAHREWHCYSRLVFVLFPYSSLGSGNTQWWWHLGSRYCILCELLRPQTVAGWMKSRPQREGAGASKGWKTFQGPNQVGPERAPIPSGGAGRWVLRAGLIWGQKGWISVNSCSLQALRWTLSNPQVG